MHPYFNYGFGLVVLLLLIGIFLMLTGNLAF